MTDTDILAILEMAESQNSKYVTFNEAIRQLEGMLVAVKDRDNSGPPGSPAAGDVYIVDSATGAWASASVDDIAYYYGSAWHFFTPPTGLTVHVIDEARDYTFDGSNWVPAHRQSGIALLASVTAGMQTADGKTNIFTVPTGKSMIVTHVVIRNPTASLAGGTDYDLGDGANADTWKTAIDLSGMTATTDYIVITNDNTKITVFDASDVFGIKPVTGSTADADATIELFGYLF